MILEIIGLAAAAKLASTIVKPTSKQVRKRYEAGDGYAEYEQADQSRCSSHGGSGTKSDCDHYSHKK
jgi:hypothetical protein